MKKREDAESLARMMVRIAEKAGKRVSAFVSDMDQPLGDKIGNAMEVVAAIECLKGRAPEDYTKLTIELASEMLYLSGLGDREACHRKAITSIYDGSAFAKFVEMVRAHGGDTRYVERPELFPKAKEYVVRSKRFGYISSINAEGYGIASLMLGAGRNTKEDVIDPSAGILVLKKKGDYVNEGDPICILYSNRDCFSEAEEKIISSVEICENCVNSPSFYISRVE